MSTHTCGLSFVLRKEVTRSEIFLSQCLKMGVIWKECKTGKRVRNYHLSPSTIHMIKNLDIWAREIQISVSASPHLLVTSDRLTNFCDSISSSLKCGSLFLSRSLLLHYHRPSRGATTCPERMFQGRGPGCQPQIKPKCPTRDLSRYLTASFSCLPTAEVENV